jgi:hypothetical protein
MIYQESKYNKKNIRAQLFSLLYEEDLGTDLGLEDEVTQEKEKEIKKLEQSRHDEIDDILRRTFFRIKNDSEVIKRYRELYNKLEGDNDRTMTDFYEKLYRDLKKMFKQQFQLTGIDKSVFDLFPDLMQVINDEFEKAYINIKERVTETGTYK